MADHEFAAQMRLSQGCGAGTGIPSQSSRLMSDLDTTPRMPHARALAESVPVYVTPEPIIPKLDLTYVHRRPVHTGDADRMHVPKGLLEDLAARGLLRDSDDC